MSQITAIDKYLHQARMLHIQGKVEDSLAMYKYLIQHMLQNASQYPQYKDYYRQYAGMLLEEAEAIKQIEAQKQQKQATEEIHFFLPNDDEEMDNHTYEETSEFPPIPPRSEKPKKGSRESSNANALTKSDIQYAAAGVVNQIQQFNNEYQVTEKCKNAYSACANKAKELDNKYEISRKARELGTQIQQWDERNGVSEAITNGIKKAANAVEGAVKDYADKSRKNPNVRIDRFEKK